VAAKTPEIVEVDPRTFYLPTQRRDGADPLKLARQIAKHGKSIDGMPLLLLVRGKDGHLRINDGVTRATRVAKLLPGTLIKGEIIEDRPKLDVTREATVAEKLP
jgi:hypothetical protein